MVLICRPLKCKYGIWLLLILVKHNTGSQFSSKVINKEFKKEKEERVMTYSCSMQELIAHNEA